MNELTMQLEEHEDEITDDIVDMLLSFSDFEEFKNLMLSYKQNETPSFESTAICMRSLGLRNEILLFA